MKTALGQLHLYWEDKQKNLEKIERYMQMLSKKDTDLFLLPEMSLTGFSMRTEKTKENHKETVGWIQKLAGKYDMAVGVGWVQDAGALCENHYSIVTPEAEILDYTKLHPFRYGGETEYFQGGNELPTCEYKGVRIGVQICYDLRFPEPFQKLSNEVDLIIVPANWPAARSSHWKCLLQARAIENMVYLAGVNCAGEMDGRYYSGDSGMYMPDGEKAEMEILRIPDSCSEECVMFCEWKNEVSKYRERFPMKEDRRESFYKKL